MPIKVVPSVPENPEVSGKRNCGYLVLSGENNLSSSYTCGGKDIACIEA